MAESPSTPGTAAFFSRDFRLYQMARVMVIIGAEAQALAVAWQVYQITHRALDLGYTGLALFLPWGVAEAHAPLALVLALPVLVFKLAIGGALLALLETASAKMRIFRVPEFLGTAFMLAVIGVLVHILLGV